MFILHLPAENRNGRRVVTSRIHLSTFPRRRILFVDIRSEGIYKSAAALSLSHTHTGVPVDKYYAPRQRMKLRIAERTINRLRAKRSGKEGKMFVAMVLHKHNKHNNGNNSNHHSSNNNSTRTANNINNNHINNNVTNLNQTFNSRAVSVEDFLIDHQGSMFPFIDHYRTVKLLWLYRARRLGNARVKFPPLFISFAVRTESNFVPFSNV